MWQSLRPSKQCKLHLSSWQIFWGNCNCWSFFNLCWMSFPNLFFFLQIFLPDYFCNFWKLLLRTTLPQIVVQDDNFAHCPSGEYLHFDSPEILFCKVWQFSSIWLSFCTDLIPFPFEQYLMIYLSAIRPQVLIQLLLVRQKVCRLLAVRQKEERARLAVTVGTGAACQKLLPMHCIAPTSSREARAFQGTHDLGKTEDRKNQGFKWNYIS